MIKNVYSSYKAKGLIDENFPELTLNQMLMKLENFERYVMESYGKEDMAVLNDIDIYRNNIEEFRNKVYGLITDNWYSKNIDPNAPIILTTPNAPVVYPLKKEITGGDETALQKISDSISELDTILKKYTKLLNENKTFGSDGQAKIDGEKIETTLSCNIGLSNLLTQISNLDDIDYESTFELRQGRAGSEWNSNFWDDIKGKLQIDGYQVNGNFRVEDSQLKRTYFIFGDIVGSRKYGTSSFLGRLQRLSDDFETKRKLIEDKLSEALAKNKISWRGIRFNPTIKNIIGNILSADAFLD